MANNIEKALQHVLDELKNQREANEAVTSAVKGLQVALGEFHHDHAHDKTQNQEEHERLRERLERLESERPA